MLTSSDLEAVNGTNVRLKCTFKSTSPLSEDKISVSWNFQPLGKTAGESVSQCRNEKIICILCFVVHSLTPLFRFFVTVFSLPGKNVSPNHWLV